MRHDNDNALGIDFGSVCSGIEAASVAWHPLGMRAAWVSEIEPFPSAVLAHHYPDTPNHGDMTALASRVLAGEVHAPSVLVGGTPCQAFSVAGARAGMDDPRGRLTISYVELANAIDHVRASRGDDPCVIAWENVPGIFSDRQNAFGCFLGALAGEDCELQPSGKRWPDAGCVYGPQRAIAWRVLDAQYFGLAQRRRRVFVVASARDGFDPAAILFERDSLRRDFAPSREARKDVAALTANGVGTCGADDNQAQAGHLIASTGDVSHCLNAGGMGRQDYETETLVVGFHHNAQADQLPPSNGRDTSITDSLTCSQGAAVCITGITTHALTAEGHDASEDGTGRGTPIVAYAIGSHAGAADGDQTNRSHATGGPVGSNISEELAYSLRAGRTQSVAISVALRGREGGATAEMGDDLAGCLRASGGGGDKPHVLTAIGAVEVSDTLSVGANQTTGTKTEVVSVAGAVRRLTPTECERLQGFPDGYTLIPYGAKLKAEAKEELAAFFTRTGQYMREVAPDQWEFDRERFEREWPRMAADGPRYKALGNSMAVPVMRWIGGRIVAHLSAIHQPAIRSAA